MVGWAWGGPGPASHWTWAYYGLVVAVLLPRLHQTLANTTAKLVETSVVGVAGGTGQLPCIVRNLEGGAPVLVLWYKDGARLPFYTLDLREDGPREESAAEEVQGRVRSDETGLRLTLSPLAGSDSARYKCRVDFDNQPTLSALVNLTVYVVPSRLMVTDTNNQPVQAGLVGPLVLGAPLTLYCVATGGWPTPKVSWWRGSTLLADHSLVLNGDGAFQPYPHHSPADGSVPSLVRTELTIPSVSREYAHANLTCRAANNNITEPLSTALYLDVYLPPSKVEIKWPNAPLVEGRQARLECAAIGAYPSVAIAWDKTIAGRTTQLQAQTRQRGDRWLSYLVVLGEAGDHGATLTCTATNPKVPQRPASTSIHLQVEFAPRVSLRLGASLANQHITEAKDVYFECDVASNPQARDVMWSHNGERVVHQRKAGVLVSQKNLVLQTVRRTSAGNYTCTATNTHGSTTSNTVPLRIEYHPECRGGPQTVAVAEGEDVTLRCEVDAQPEVNLTFTWLFNNTLDTIEVDRARVQVRPGYSFLVYTPRSSRDYGTLACWSQNIVGTQPEPCVFTVVEAGPPESVSNCVLANLTEGTLDVECVPGADGGLMQRFEARVYATSTQLLVDTLTGDAPRFHVEGLTQGQDYLISVVAINEKGASIPQEIDAVRLKVAEKRMGEVSARAVPQAVIIFVALVSGFILLLLLALLITRIRANYCLPHGGRSDGCDVVATLDSTVSRSPATVRRVHMKEDEDEEAPDVLRTVNESAQLLDGLPRPEIIPVRQLPPPYSHHKPHMKDGVALGPGGVVGSLYADPTINLPHLPHDESFV